ncbi:MAG: isocitrate lyase/PEP mutase family protein [Chloroflexi bacterium]|uniref:2-methylisocitrate lyase n=1 Tax=Candidatus Chlorohelix allophototropha TaxID=3003348 RepID=A0A8T7LXQ4_9CHLR|nr:isocitrate lyase/PEP mutase family protein [Chloroflexota bacterium]WJW67536.1 isocitrate lyase/PEP mutase family protein [Chloroflexota bacterium L227-S17]
MRASTMLRKMMSEEGIIVAPGAYDGISARLIERAGFKAIYMTGAGTSASLLGNPDLGLTTQTEMANHAANIAECVSVPVIADADTGYGNPLNVVRTVRLYERSGVAALHLEDQTFPKRCGHVSGKQVIPKEEFAQKIRAAAEYRTDPDLVIIARTDARAINGFDDAIERANYYHEAGADMIFVESPINVEEMALIPKLVKAPVMMNLPTGGRTPMIPYPQLQEMGYKLVIYPTTALYAAIFAIEQRLQILKETGNDEYEQKLELTNDIFEKMRMSWWLNVDKNFSREETPN